MEDDPRVKQERDVAREKKKNTKKNIILDLNAKRKMIDFPNLPHVEWVVILKYVRAGF